LTEFNDPRSGAVSLPLGFQFRFTPEMWCRNRKGNPKLESSGCLKPRPPAGVHLRASYFVLAVKISFPGLEKVLAISRSALDGLIT
jgi:hypothetical protein